MGSVHNMQLKPVADTPSDECAPGSFANGFAILSQKLPTHIRRLTGCYAPLALALSCLVASADASEGRRNDPAASIVPTRISYSVREGHRSVKEVTYELVGEQLTITRFALNSKHSNGDMRVSCFKIADHERASLHELARVVIRERWLKLKSFDQMDGAQVGRYGPSEVLSIEYPWNGATERIQVSFVTVSDDFGTRATKRFSVPEVLVIQRRLGELPSSSASCEVRSVA